MAEAITSRELAAEERPPPAVRPTIALCLCRNHNAEMPVHITIRDVPDEVRNELAARAALQSKSMQEYLRGELSRLAARPTVEAWLTRLEETPAAELLLGHSDEARGLALH